MQTSGEGKMICVPAYPQMQRFTRAGFQYIGNRLIHETELNRDPLEPVTGSYIPEIYGLAKAMLMTKDTDEAMAAAWNNSMDCLRDVCQQTINTLAEEGRLAPAWSIEEATDMFVTVVSISGWEQLVKECHWSNEQYINKIKTLLKQIFVKTG